MTQVEAESEMFACLLTAWNVFMAAQQPVINPEPKICWPGEATPEPDASYIWAGPSFQVIQKGQKTLRRLNDQSLFEATALFTVSIFAPKSSATALKTAKLLGQAIEVKVSKQSPSGQIWFRDARSGPVGGTATQNQVNVVVTCIYENQQ